MIFKEYFLIPIIDVDLIDYIKTSNWFEDCHELPNVGIFIPYELFSNVKDVRVNISTIGYDLYPPNKSYMDIIGSAISKGFSNLPPGIKDPGE